MPGVRDCAHIQFIRNNLVVRDLIRLARLDEGLQLREGKHDGLRIRSGARRNGVRCGRRDRGAVRGLMGMLILARLVHSDCVSGDATASAVNSDAPERRRCRARSPIEVENAGAAEDFFPYVFWRVIIQSASGDDARQAVLWMAPVRVAVGLVPQKGMYSVVPDTRRRRQTDRTHRALEVQQPHLLL